VDLNKLTTHLKETLSVGTATSAIYRLRVGSPEKFVRVKTVSKFFKANMAQQEPEFIMATHSIIGYVPLAGITRYHLIITLFQILVNSHLTSKTTILHEHFVLNLEIFHPTRYNFTHYLGDLW